MSKKSRKFCVCQKEFEEDKGKETYSCLAHLDSGKIFPCPYNESEIKVVDEFGNGYKFMLQRNPEPKVDGVCRDFKIISNIKKDLIKKIVEDLERS